MQKVAVAFKFRMELIGLVMLSLHLNAQHQTYQINIDVAEKKIQADHLNLGGKDPAGNEISVNNYYLSYNKKPIIPVTAEFHFSRYPENFWDESIKKIKAGGANIIATYVFWNMHEEHEGKFVWTGNRNLRKFIELCQQNDIQVIIRIGPFAHGEIRNGALPDWLLAKPLVIRSSDEKYLTYVDRLYTEIGAQLKGLYFKDGGPVIATQLENEFQHSAAPWGLTYPGQPSDWTASEKDLAVTHEGVAVADGVNANATSGARHMKDLKSLAQKAGIITPLYTATGWGNATIVANESLPVTAGYAYPTWTKQKDLSDFYLYKDLTKKPDYAPVSYDPEQYPAFAAELGVGIMSTYSRRPVVPAASTDALINRCLGSGANGIGYYMFHGGSTPKGDFYFNDEAYAYPKISYDFQAPIGEFGQIRPSYKRLKLIHYFTESFGNLLAPMMLVLPETHQNLTPRNIDTLRYSVRTYKGSGLVFINNFQDDTTLTDKKNIQINLLAKKGNIVIPKNGDLSISSGENAILPFNLDLNGTLLHYATAQLLTKSADRENPYYVFFTPEGMRAELAFDKATKISGLNQANLKKEGNMVMVRPSGDLASFEINAKGVKTQVLVISKKLALNAWTASINGKTHLIITEANVIQDKNQFTLLSEDKNHFEIAVFPEMKGAPTLSNGSITKKPGTYIFSSFQVELPKVRTELPVTRFGSNKLGIDLSKGIPDGLNDVRIILDYVGDTGMAFSNGTLYTDDFYKGIPWEISARHFLDNPANKQLDFYFRPLYKHAPFLVNLSKEVVDNFTKKGLALDISRVRFIPEYKAVLTLGETIDSKK